LVYDDTKPFPSGQPVDAWNDFDDFALVPYDKQPRLDNVKHTVTLDVVMGNLKDGAN
jgi:iron transport multicopper oxidase